MPHINPERPNPLTLSISLDENILKEIEFFDVSRATIEDADYFPLAKALMKHEGIANVLVSKDPAGNDYISIRKSHQAWHEKEEEWALSVIDHFTQGKHTMLLEAAIVKAGKAAEQFVPKTVPERVISGIFMQVMLPVVKRDGGSFQIHKVTENPDNTVDVDISMLGACTGCPSAKEFTLKGAKMQLKRAFRQMSDMVDGKEFGDIHVYDPSNMKAPEFTI